MTSRRVGTPVAAEEAPDDPPVPLAAPGPAQTVATDEAPTVEPEHETEDARVVEEVSADEPYAALCRATICLDGHVTAGSFVWISYPPDDPYMKMLLANGYLVVMQTH